MWKKCTDMPARLTNYIVDICKANQAPPIEIQHLIKKYMFTKYLFFISNIGHAVRGILHGMPFL